MKWNFLMYCFLHKLTTLSVIVTLSTFTIQQAQSQVCNLPSLSADIVATCESASNGSIDLQVTGTGSYTYLWSPGGQTTEDINNLIDGLYEVTVTVNGDVTCTISEAFLVEENAEPFANAGLDKGQCENGTFTMTAVEPDIGSGLWTFNGPANGAVITTPTSNTTTVTGLEIGKSATLIWTITNINCIDQDEVILTNSTQMFAEAGPDQEQCNNSTFTLDATSPSLGAGSWTIVGLPNGANISNPSLPNSDVTGLNEGKSVTLRWVVINGTCFDSDDIILTNSSSVVSIAGPNQTNCNNGLFTLAGNDPFIGSGFWSIIGDKHGATIVDSTLYNASINGLEAGHNIILRWTVQNGACIAEDEISLSNDQMVMAVAGDDQANCDNDNFTLSAETPITGSGSWSIVGAPGGAVIQSPASPTSMVSGLNNGSSVTLRWSVFNGTCFSTDDVILFNDREVFSAVGPNQSQCNNGTFSIIANSPSLGTGSWSFSTPPISAVITNPTSPSAIITGVQPDETVSARWTIDNRGCVEFAEVLLTNDAMVYADARPDLYSCNIGDFIMDANDNPTNGSGFWEILGAPNGAWIVNPNDPKSAVRDLNIDQSATLKWTLTNGNCISADTINLFHSAPVLAHAGSNQEKCTEGDFILAGNDPVIGIGKWAFVGDSLNAILVDPSAYNSQVTGLLLTESVTLRWTVTNGGCQKMEDVRLTNHPEVFANAGQDQSKCENGDFILAAEEPVEGFGVWSIIGDANGVIIDDVADHNSLVSDLEVGSSVTLRWYVTNGGCEAEDEVVLTNFEDVSAFAGSDQSNCFDGSFTLSATEPNIGMGIWSIVGPSNGLIISTPSVFNTTVSGLNSGFSTTLLWTVTNGDCVQTDEVTLTNYANVTAEAGPDQSNCSDGSFTLAADQPDIGAGEWSVIGSANGTFITDPNDHNTSITGLLEGTTVVLRWTVTNGDCVVTNDVTLTNYQDVTSNAGQDQSICNNGSFTLLATEPNIGDGFWSFIGAQNGASLHNPALHETQITGLNSGTSTTLRWTVSNGTCSSFDDVVITNDEAVFAGAGEDQTQCDQGDFTLSALEPNVGRGVWTISDNTPGVSISDSSIFNTSITGLTAGQSVTLSWTLTNGVCSSSDEVILTNNEQVFSNAGPDQTNCNNSSFTLAGNPPSIGSGLWTIVGMSHGTSISNPALFNSTVSGLMAGQSVRLRWTVTNNTCSQYDEVVLTNDELISAVAGEDQINCNNGTFILDANAVNTGTGIWSFVDNPQGATIINHTEANAVVSNLTPGQELTLRWTITNGSCIETDDVLLTNNSPVSSDAGEDLMQCDESTFLLKANEPSIGIGTWSIIGANHGAMITDIHAHNSTLTGLSVDQPIQLRWTINNDQCSDSDDVSLINSAAVVASAGEDITRCNQSTFTLQAIAPSLGVGSWSYLGDSLQTEIDDKNSHSTTLNGLEVNESVELSWTVVNGACQDVDDITITNDLSTINCPNNVLLDPCLTQSEINLQFTLWIASFEGSTNSAGTISYSVTKDNMPEQVFSTLENILPPDSSGGNIVITINVLCSGDMLTCSSSFDIQSPPNLESTAPDPVSKNSCSGTEDFNLWLEGFQAQGGCQSVITYDVTFYESISKNPITLVDLTDLSEVEAPSSCGGNIEVRIRIKSSFGFPEGQFSESTSSSTYTIEDVDPIAVFGPEDFEVDTMSTQNTIDLAFNEWIGDFGFSGGVCGNLDTTDLGIFSPPPSSGGTSSLFSGSFTTIKYVAGDQCTKDSVVSTFSVPPFIQVPNEITLTGPQVVCANNDGYIYQVDTLDAEFYIVWTFTGTGGIITEQVGNTVEMGYTGISTEGFLKVEVSDNFSTISDSIYIMMAESEVCNIYCQGILFISDFMINNPSMPDSIDYWAEYIIRSDATIESEGEVTFNAGLSIELMQEFKIETGGQFEINIDHCDGIGFQDNDEYEAFKLQVKDIDDH